MPSLRHIGLLGVCLLAAGYIFGEHSNPNAPDAACLLAMEKLGLGKTLHQKVAVAAKPPACPPQMLAPPAAECPVCPRGRQDEPVSAADSQTPAFTECMAKQVRFWGSQKKQVQIDPGAAEQVPVVVSRVLRRVFGEGQDSFAAGMSLIDIGANKGRYSALLMDNTCNTIERRFVAAGLAGKLGQIAAGFSVPGFPVEADGSQNKWVGEFSKPVDPACPDIYAVEAMPDTYEVLKGLAEVHGFPKDQFHLIHAAMMDKDTTIRFKGSFSGDESAAINPNSADGVEVKAYRFDTLIREHSIQVPSYNSCMHRAI
jgi:hypothetical protein